MKLNKRYIIIAILIIILIVIAWQFFKIIEIVKVYAMGKITNYTGSEGFITDMNIPLGVRNNNPGNIRKTGITWLGEAKDEENNTQFEKFYTYELGIRALIRNMQTIIGDSANTIEKLITVWAPPVENKTENYIRNVEYITGIDRNMKIDRFNKIQMTAIADAIITQENGNGYSTTEQLNKAWSLL